MSTHSDPGLQPERTVMAWGRTLLALVTVSTIFLRWLPAHGLPVLALIATAAAAATCIFATQNKRYRRGFQGVCAEQIRADVSGVFALSTAVLLLGAFSMIARMTF